MVPRDSRELAEPYQPGDSEGSSALPGMVRFARTGLLRSHISSVIVSSSFDILTADNETPPLKGIARQHQPFLTAFHVSVRRRRKERQPSTHRTDNLQIIPA